MTHLNPMFSRQAFTQKKRLDRVTRVAYATVTVEDPLRTRIGLASNLAHEALHVVFNTYRPPRPPPFDNTVTDFNPSKFRDSSDQEAKIKEIVRTCVNDHCRLERIGR